MTGEVPRRVDRAAPPGRGRRPRARLGAPVVAAALALLALAWGTQHAPPAHAAPDTACTVERVIDGDTFVCTDARHIRMLQINAPELRACGGGWARDALASIFLRPGTPVRLEYDAVPYDRYGRDLAAPIVTGTDGAAYNISIVMVYVGLARAAYYGDNARYLEWARASETWARAAQWNMWAPGGPFNGATHCG